MAAERKNGKVISLHTLTLVLLIAAVVLSVLLIFFTQLLFVNYHQLTQIAEKHVLLRKDALEMMDASDYLTERVQRFTVDGDTDFMDQYFTEAFRSQHREEALEMMSEESSDQAAIKALQAAMNASNDLMQDEYYAMRLVVEAKGYTDYPAQLDQVTLTDADSALDAHAKMHRAAQIVLGEGYYEKKTTIRESLDRCLAELEKTADTADKDALSALGSELANIRIVIILQLIGIGAFTWLMTRLAIRPTLNAVDCIKQDRMIPESGAAEFRYLFSAYNKVYKYYKKSLAKLTFKASHDELTGVYNRAGYESLLSSLDLQTTYMILFDVDNFKHINDTYGHEVGDQVLVKIAGALKKHFRSDDHICRVGGDEFVVFMVNAEKKNKDLIRRKIEQINQTLESTDDGLPKSSISVGVAHGSEVTDVKALFEIADDAMYAAKKNGKHGFIFSKDLEGQ